MFIPVGATIHESLATSYVLVDALVADLCEGGFSGVVEVVLRNTDSFIIIATGDVAAVLEKRDVANAAPSYARTTVDELAQRSRRERGRVSVHGYSAAIANAVAGRINAQPLYLGLSTEFTDLDKMISKLVREADREWFIEVSTENGPTALIHMREAECRVITTTGDAKSGALDVAGNPELRRLVDECNRAGGTFDVYFRRPAGAIGETVERTDLETVPEPHPAESHRENEEPVETERPSFHPTESAPLAGHLFTEPSRVGQPFALAELGEPGLEPDGLPGVSNVAAGAAATHPSLSLLAEAAATAPAPDLIEPQSADLSNLRDELPPAAAGAEEMSEIKRLMGEIARAIEEAALAVGRPDGFSMSLRAGQLRIADRFPFLDPFAGDFEYLAGEIVFVGQARAEEFVAGLSEALKLAIEAVLRSTAYGERFRSYVSEDLQKLLARERAEFERFGLDHVIQDINTSLQ